MTSEDQTPIRVRLPSLRGLVAPAAVLVFHLTALPNTNAAESAIDISEKAVPAIPSNSAVSVGIADVLDIRVYGDASTGLLSGRYLVDPNGVIHFPLLGQITVNRNSTSEISAQ